MQTEVQDVQAQQLGYVAICWFLTKIKSQEAANEI